MTLDELKNDWDWKHIFIEYAPQNEWVTTPGETHWEDKVPIEIDDIEEIVAAENGDNEGPDWTGVFKLKNGLYLYLVAGCDYSGWG